MKEKKFTTKKMTELALLTAIVLLMAFTPIGYIKTFGLEITLIVIPVVVGAITLGPAGGAILGAVFGITSFVRCFGMDPFGTTLFSINPFGTFFTCIVTRTLMGFLTGVLYQALRKKALSKASAAIASLAGPLLNTILFMGSLVLFFYKTDYIQGFANTLGVSNPFAFVLAFVGINGVVEIAVCLILGTAISKALQAALK